MCIDRFQYMWYTKASSFYEGGRCMTPEGVNMTFFYVMLAVGGLGVVLAVVGGVLFGVFAGKENSRPAGIGFGMAFVGVIMVVILVITALVGIEVAGKPVHVSQDHYADVVQDGAVAVLVDVTEEKYYFAIQSVFSRTDYENGDVTISWRTKRLLVSIDREDVTFKHEIVVTNELDRVVKSRISQRYMLRVESFENGDRITATSLPLRRVPTPQPPIRHTEEISPWAGQ